MRLYNIDMMVKLLERCSKVFKDLNGDAVASLNKMQKLSFEIDGMLSKIEGEKNE